MEDNFLTQLVGEPTRGGALLDLLFTNREGLVGGVMVGGCLGLSDREMIEFSIWGEARKGVSKTTAMDFRRANFGLFEALVESPLGDGPEGQRAQEGWTFFKKEILTAQDQAIPTCRKSNR